MTVRKTNVYMAQRLNLYDLKGKPDAGVTWAKVEGIIAGRTRKLPASGVKAIRLAYDEAKTKAGKNPTLKEINAIVNRNRSSLENERAKGRINDGYVDSNEVAGLKSPVAKAMYAFVDAVTSDVPVTRSSMSASSAELNSAYKKLEGVVGKAFDKFRAMPASKNYPQLIGAMRSAAKEANLPASAVSALIIATNGKTSRGDNGSVTDGGHSLPTEAEVKQGLKNALDKLKAADGAKIVDFKNPAKAPASKKDGVITELEALRTPSVTGQAAFKLLEYASSL